MSPASRRRVIPPVVTLALTVAQADEICAGLGELAAAARARSEDARSVVKRIETGHTVNGFPAGEPGRLLAAASADNDAHQASRWASLLREVQRMRGSL